LVRQARRVLRVPRARSAVMVALAAIALLAQRFYSQLLAVAAGAAGQSVLWQVAAAVVADWQVQALPAQHQRA